MPPCRDLNGDTDCEVRILIGDVAGSGGGSDGEVHATIDTGAVKAQNREPISASNCQYDLNGDGRINLIDAALCKARAGNSVP